ncbi:TetR/AcrR family transcriptional regulator [Streptomyces sp. NEAU-YJ-81]|uniref:TetR/AcrR family transcriptional regulator n=1 Tax=Streptomyces sp. NEAU-YJ-81 TaxID=2820288 RepID=UPI001ABC7B12|nr:TetR/AcrR family transcriptional regulator [Streptomyces sp. NEAU-YJ-81]MBO3682521.1 TetR/AcrR family transcriptional regulator [Streptomyces sp. NEAU-YJ-81]
MPRNRAQVPLEERRADLIAAATEVFLTCGYEGATMEGISKAAGVTRANVYWYFKSKDEVFAAVMRQMLGRDFLALAAEHADLDPMSRLTRGLVSMRSYRPLHQAMHDRLMHHDGVRQAHDLWLEWLRDMVRQVLDERGIDADRDLAAHLIEAVFEAVHVPLEHRRPPHEMIHFIIERLGEPPARRSS